MRKLVMGLALAATAAIAACDAGGSSPGSDGLASVPDTALNYENGHTLLLPNDDPGVATFESELLRLVNDYRLSRGLSPLLDSSRLGNAARAHARHMIDHRFFAHATPEGFSPEERLSLAGVDWTSVGENIAEGYSTPQEVFDRWMGSPEHRANIESTRFTYASVGYALDPAPTAEWPQVHFWSMAFFRP